MIIEKRFAFEQGEHGSKRIIQTGRCSGDFETIQFIEGNVTRVFTLEQFPNARGVILKSLDGNAPIVVEVEPPTMPGVRYNCVKVEGVCTPFAAQQDSGVFEGMTVLSYRIVWQQVGTF